MAGWNMKSLRCAPYAGAFPVATGLCEANIKPTGQTCRQPLCCRHCKALQQARAGRAEPGPGVVLGHCRVCRASMRLHPGRWARPRPRIDAPACGVSSVDQGGANQAGEDTIGVARRHDRTATDTGVAVGGACNKVPAWTHHLMTIPARNRPPRFSPKAGLPSAAKSSSPSVDRMPVTRPRSIGFGPCLNRSIASSIDFPCPRQTPATRAAIPANLPSFSLRWSREN